MKERICPYCDGEGGRHEKEGRHDVFDACYACGTTGKVSEARYQQYRLEVVVDLIAAKMVDDQQAACNSDPDGEGWDFHAAKNGMSGYEYAQAKFHDYRGKVVKQFKDIDPVVLEDIKDRLRADDPEKTLLFRTYKRGDFPNLEDWIARTLLSLIYPPEPQCSNCGPMPQVRSRAGVISVGDFEDDGGIPF
jgi:hypothetical protein